MTILRIEKKTEFNYDAKEVNEIEYYVSDWIDKKTLRRKDIKSNPKLRNLFCLFMMKKYFDPDEIESNNYDTILSNKNNVKKI